MGVGSSLYMYDVVVKRSRSLSHLLMSSCVSKVSRRVSTIFLSVQLSQLYIATGHTSTFITRIFVEIGML